MYQQGKAVVQEVQKTVNEVKEIAEEVQGFWAELASFFTNKPKIKPKIAENKQKQAEKPVKSKNQEFDQNALYAEIGKKLTEFFKAYNALKAHIEEEEEKSKTVYDPTGDQTEKAVQRVLAMSQMEDMGVQLREYMVYQVPQELKDLYTRINEMIGTIANEQAIAKQAMLKKRAETAWQQKQKQNRIWYKSMITVIVAIISIYMVVLMWAIHLVTISHTDI